MKKTHIMLSATILLSLNTATQSMDETTPSERRPSFDATRDSNPLTTLLGWTQRSRAEWTATHEGETQIHYGENREVRFGSTGGQVEIDRLEAIAPYTNKETQDKIAAHIAMLKNKMAYTVSTEEKEIDTPYQETTEEITQNIVPEVVKHAAWTNKKTTKAIIAGLLGEQEEENAWAISQKQLKKQRNRKKYLSK